jgi:predicted nuclease of predicted toxin-antitoxin system
MKLLFDENLPRSLVRRLGDVWPGSAHVSAFSLEQADDRAIWEFAAEYEFIIVTKDSDFHALSIIQGAPPKVVWLLIGNCSIQDVEDLLRLRAATISDFDSDPDATVLSLER